MKNVSVWSRSLLKPLFLPGADPIGSEPAPGPRTSGAGAARKSDGSATLRKTLKNTFLKTFLITFVKHTEQISGYKGPKH